MVTEAKKQIAKNLQAKINVIQGLDRFSGESSNIESLPFASAFPCHVFPTGVIHEFLSYEPADAASTNGFITALTGKLMKEGGLCLWVGSQKKIFPLGLKHYGINPDRIVFINPSKVKDALWIMEEALKCEALTAVIGEIREFGFTESRRFQLAVERSGVTGFVHRYRPHAENATASTARWKITPLSATTNDDLPGVGHSCWDVQLVKVKNGRPGSWQVTWIDETFMPVVQKHFSIASDQNRNAG
ncbi:MAG: hypothetical protein QM710_14375 [Flavobacterium sp.]